MGNNQISILSIALTELLANDHYKYLLILITQYTLNNKTSQCILLCQLTHNLLSPTQSSLYLLNPIEMKIVSYGFSQKLFCFGIPH